MIHPAMKAVPAVAVRPVPRPAQAAAPGLQIRAVPAAEAQVHHLRAALLRQVPVPAVAARHHLRAVPAVGRPEAAFWDFPVENWFCIQSVLVKMTAVAMMIPQAMMTAVLQAPHPRAVVAPAALRPAQARHPQVQVPAVPGVLLRDLTAVPDLQAPAVPQARIHHQVKAPHLKSPLPVMMTAVLPVGAVETMKI